MKKHFRDIDWGSVATYTVTGVLIVLAYLLLNHLGTIFHVLGRVYYYLRTFFAGLAVAYVLRPVVVFFCDTVFKKLGNRKAANSLSVVITILLLLGLVTLILYTAIPQVVQSLTVLVSNLENYYLRLVEFVNHLREGDLVRKFGLDAELDNLLSSSENIFERLRIWITENLGDIALTFKDVGASVINVLLSFILSVYLLLDWNRFFYQASRLSKALFPEKFRAEIGYIAVRSDYILKGFIRSNLLDAVIIGLVNFLVMTIFGMPYAPLISLIVGVTNIVPTVGPVIGYVPSALLLLFTNPWQALWFTILTVVLQLADSNLIKPLIFKDAVGLPAVWILVSILVGARIGGLLGMLLAIPVTAILAFLLEDFIGNRLKKRQLPDEPPPDQYTSEKREKKVMQGYIRRMRKAQRKQKKEAPKE